MKIYRIMLIPKEEGVFDEEYGTALLKARMVLVELMRKNDGCHEANIWIIAILLKYFPL